MPHVPYTLRMSLESSGHCDSVARQELRARWRCSNATNILSNLSLRLNTYSQVGTPAPTIHYCSRRPRLTSAFIVLFELVGMLGRPMHIRGIAGRTLPNPLPYRWDDKSFSPKRLLTAYVNRVLDGVPYSIEYGEVARTISSMKTFTSDPQFHLLPESDPQFLHKLHDMVDWCDDELLQWDNESRREIRLVISTHIQTFWGSLMKSQEPKLHDSSSNLQSSFCHFDKLDLEDRERALVEIYFDTVYPRHRQAMGPLDKPSQQPWDILFNEKPQTAAIWPLLMLRMVCWLNLHTFHAADVQLPKVDLMGTRLPVYIS